VCGALPPHASALTRAQRTAQEEFDEAVRINMGDFDMEVRTSRSGRDPAGVDPTHARVLDSDRGLHLSRLHACYAPKLTPLITVLLQPAEAVASAVEEFKLQVCVRPLAPLVCVRVCPCAGCVPQRV
jgi:hypothetical protein